MKTGRSSSVRRVVVLSRDRGFAELQGGAAPASEQIVRVPNGYEATAEILAEDAAALLIDLRALGSRHLRLLEVARETGVEMLVVGTMPAGMSSDVLSGARLLARSDLPDTIGRIVGEEMRPKVGAVRRAGGLSEVEDVDQEARSEVQEPTAVKLAPAKSPPKGRVKVPAGDPQGPSDMVQQDEALLTPEELSALLEDES